MDIDVQQIVLNLVGNNLSIKNLPPEDLVIINEVRKIASNYGDIKPIVDESNLKIVVDDTNSQKVEVFDNETGPLLLQG